MKKLLFLLTAVLLTAASLHAATSYGFTVGGVTVTSDNCNNVTGSAITSGTVKYDSSTKTLTLTNVTINGTSYYCIYNYSCHGLNVLFEGTCNLVASSSAGVKASANTTLKVSSGSTANITGKTNNGEGVYIDRGTLYLEGPGILNINSDYASAICGGGHDSYFVQIFSSAKVNLRSTYAEALNYIDILMYSNSYAYVTATNNTYDKPVVANTTFEWNKANGILSPVGAYAANNTVYYSTGSQIKCNTIIFGDLTYIPINSTNFPDDNFRAHMLGLYPKGFLTPSDISSLTELNVSNRSISNMKGIELLTGLTKLKCYNNPFENLDLSSNTELKYLDCAPTSGYTGTRLKNINLSNCTKLEELYLYNTDITWLGLSSCTSLKTLSCYNTKLVSLDVTGMSQLASINCSNCTSMTKLYCFRDALTSLNVSGNTALTELQCFENANLETITGLSECAELTTLNCDHCKIGNLSAVNSLDKLQTLRARYNNLTSLTITEMPQLSEIQLTGNTSLTSANISSNNALTHLYIDGCTSMTSLSCNNNRNLTTFNVADNTRLKELRCYTNDNLSSISYLYSCTALTYLDCEDCRITSLSGVNSLTYLEELYCRNNRLTSLTVTNKPNLTRVRAYGNPLMTEVRVYSNSALTSLDLYNCGSLSTLYCYRNALTTLDIEGCAAIKQLECNENANLQTITGLTDCTAITYLNCDDCKIADLSAANSMGNLEELYCRNNQLTSLTVSNKSKLKTIDAHGNPSLTQARVYNNPLLTTFKIYNCTAMRTLTCTGNSKLSSISLTGNTGLVNLYCSNNKLTSLNVQGCSSLIMIQCCNNQITESGMTTLVNSLPSRSSSSRGTLDVLYNSNEGNVFTSAHASIAKSKYWSPCRWNGSAWVEIEGVVAGDVNGDGVLNATDVTMLLTLILNDTPSVSSYPAGDYNGDGVINTTDVTMLLTYILNS